MQTLIRRLKLPTEPVLWEGVTKAGVALFIGWPLVTLTNARQGLLLALYAAVAAVVVRAKVTPNTKVAEKVEAAVKQERVDIHDFLNGLANAPAKAAPRSRKRSVR